MLDLRSTYLSIATLLATACATSTQAAGPARPNLVIFISDDHSFLDSSVAGDAGFHTPNLQRLAHDGMTFTHAFAASPSCAPSRASLLTGLMPIRNGAMINHQPPQADVKKLPAYLHELGYEVVAFGKVAHYKQGKHYGFDLVRLDDFHQDQCVRAAVDFLNDRSSDKPLCLFVGTNWPHVPWPETAEPADPNNLRLPLTHVDTPQTRLWRSRYAAAVARFDTDLGLIYDAAYKRLGDNTLFVHFSDHGAQWPFGKWNLYDAGTRVPFFVVWPGVVKPRSQSAAMINLVDVLPTLVDAAGGAPPSDFDGRSFEPILSGKGSDHREHIFTTHSRDRRINDYPIRAVRTREWKYIRNLRPRAEHTTHISRGKAVDGRVYWESWVEAAKTDPEADAIVARNRRRPAEELYNLDSDPFEQRNLVDDPRHAQVLSQLRLQLEDWMRGQGDHGLPTEEAVANAFLESPAENTPSEAASSSASGEKQP